MTELNDEYFMKKALEAARQAADADEVPVGAVLIAADGKEILAVASNAPIANHDPTAHAEINVLRKGGAKLGNYRLSDTTLYVTLEPCAMCAGAISQARVGRLVFAAVDPKGGAVLHGPRFFDLPTCHHRPLVEHGTMAAEASNLLTGFFRVRR